MFAHLNAQHVDRSHDAELEAAATRWRRGGPAVGILRRRRCGADHPAARDER